MDATKYEVFARCLRAAGGAPCLEKEGRLYLIYVDGEDLIEQRMNGPQLEDQDVIAGPVKEDAAAAYIYLNNNQRFAFCANVDDVLEFHTYNGGWAEGDLGSVAGQKLLSGSKMQACLTPGGLQVYFQDPSGSIRCLAQKKGVWTSLGVVRGQPREKTPLSVTFSQTAVYLYYVGDGESLRRVRISYPDGNFEDAAVKGSSFKRPVENLIALHGDSDEHTDIIVLSADEVIRVDGKGERTELGTMNGRIFTASKSDQFYDMVFMNYMPIYAPGWGIGQCCLQ